MVFSPSPEEMEKEIERNATKYANEYETEYLSHYKACYWKYSYVMLWREVLRLHEQTEQLENSTTFDHVPQL
mgnify:CR=1 FL=1